jgi:hypothetical protein
MGAEIIEWGSPAHVPGLMTLRVRDSDKVWRWFHETYTFCNALCEPHCGSEWTYRGRMNVSGPDITMLLEPGETHCTMRQSGPVSFDVLLFDPALVFEAARELCSATPRPHSPCRRSATFAFTEPSAA